MLREKFGMNGIRTGRLLWIGVGIVLSVRVGLAQSPQYGRQLTRPFLRPSGSMPAGHLLQLSFRRQNGGLQLLGLADDKTVRSWQFRPDTKSLRPTDVFRWPISFGDFGLGCDLDTAADGRAALAVCPIGRSSTVYWSRSVDQWKELPRAGLGAMVVWSSVSLHPVDPDRLAVAYSVPGLDARIVVWNVAGRVPRPVQSLTSRLSRIDTLRFSPRGLQLLALDAERGHSQLWSQREGRWISPRSQPATGVTALHWAWGDRPSGLLTTRQRRLEFSGVESDSTGDWPVLINLTQRSVAYSLDQTANQRLSPGRAAWATGDQAALGLRTRPGNLPAFVNSRSPHDICYTLHTLAGEERLKLGIVESIMASATAVQQRRAALAVRELIPTVDAQGRMTSANRRVQRLILVQAPELPDADRGRYTFRLLPQEELHREIHCLAFSDDGRFLAAAGLDEVQGHLVNRLKVWDVSSGQLLAEFPRTLREVDVGLPISAVQIAPDGRGVRFAWGPYVPSIGSNRNMLETPGAGDSAGHTSSRSLDFKNGIQQDSKLRRTTRTPQARQKWVFSEVDPPRFRLRSFERSSDGELGPFPSLMQGQLPRAAFRFRMAERNCLAVASMGLIRVFDVGSKPPQLLRVFSGGHEGAITSLDVWSDPQTPAASWLLSGADDGTLCGWSLEGLESDPPAGPFRGRDQRQFVGELSLHVTSPVVAGRRETYVRAHELGLGYAWGISREVEQPVRNIEIMETAQWRRLPGSDWKRVLERPMPGRYLKLTLGDAKSGRDQELVIDVRQPPLWTMYPLVDGDWIVWANTGEFLASDRSGLRFRNRLGWHSNAVDAAAGLVARWQDVHERWSEHHNFNDLQRRLNDRLAVSSQLETHFPSKIEFVRTPAADRLPRRADFDVGVRVSQALDGEIEQVQLWCNGYLLQKQVRPSRELLHSDGSLTLTATVPAEIQRTSQENRLTARVINRFSNGDRSGSEPVEWAFRVNGPPATRRVHYLGVGVTRLDDKVVNGNRPLKYAANDAAYLSRALKTALDWEAGEFRLLLDAEQVTGGVAPHETPSVPTKRNIGQAFVELRDIVRPDDLLVVLVATHGETEDGEFYLMTRDSRDTRAHSDRRATWFSGQELKNWLSQLPCACLLLVDACHSGGLNLADSHFHFGPGPHVFVSSRNNQASFEGVRVRQIDGRWIGHGLFTAAVIDGLSGRQRDAGARMVAHRRVTNLNDLPGYVIRRVPDLLQMVLPVPSGQPSKTQEPKLIPSSTFPERVSLRRVVGP